MKFSTRDRYALRLMVELANRPNDLIPLKEISDKQRISLKYLSRSSPRWQRRAGIQRARCPGRLPPGPFGGGNHLRRDSARRRRGADGHSVSGFLGGLPHRGQCHTLDFWSGLNDLINKYVDGITLEQLRHAGSAGDFPGDFRK